jgi:peptide chain release factor 1
MGCNLIRSRQLNQEYKTLKDRKSDEYVLIMANIEEANEIMA